MKTAAINADSHNWSDLFAIGNINRPDGTIISAWCFHRNARPWLIVPLRGKAAAKSLDLYPAQTLKARLARSILRQFLRCGLAPGATRTEFTFHPNSDFGVFLSRINAGAPPSAFAILCGNPNTPGQRFVLLLFNSAFEPTAVVKAGIDEPARRLIQLEGDFLESVPTGTNGLPLQRGRFNTDSLSALALEYVPGHSPAPETASKVTGLITKWVRADETVPLGTLPGWRRIESVPGFARFILDRPNGSAMVRPVLYHGDLAPWNIKEHPVTGAWTALDWERGELRGVPGWDWFHFVVQPMILVKKEHPLTILEKIEALFHSPEFEAYARMTGIAGLEQLLFAGYLFHVLDVLKPSEGLESCRDVLNLVIKQWGEA